MVQNLVEIGILIILIGFGLIIVGSFLQSSKSDTKVAVGGFIGFIPFGFANDKAMLKIIIGLTAIIALFWFFTKLYK